MDEFVPVLGPAGSVAVHGGALALEGSGGAVAGGGGDQRGGGQAGWRALLHRERSRPAARPWARAGGRQKPPRSLREPGARPLKVRPSGSGRVPTSSAPVTAPTGSRQTKTALRRASAESRPARTAARAAWPCRDSRPSRSSCRCRNGAAKAPGRGCRRRARLGTLRGASGRRALGFCAAREVPAADFLEDALDGPLGELGWAFGVEPGLDIGHRQPAVAEG